MLTGGVVRGAGLAMGELVAARANFFTLLKMIVPLAYARLYAHGQRLPFLFAGGVLYRRLYVINLYNSHHI
jgi:hypothetical protein